MEKNMQMDQQKLQQLKKQEEQKAQQEEILQNYLSQILTNEAKERLSRIKLVKPEKAKQIELGLINMAKQGQIQGKLSEQQLISMLEQVSTQKQETKVTIQRRNYGGLDDSF